MPNKIQDLFGDWIQFDCPTDGVHYAIAVANRVWDPISLMWVSETQPSGGGSGGGPATIADGADVAEGATTDVAIITDTAGTVSGKLRGLVKIFASMWDSVNGRLRVDGSEVTQPVSGTVSVGNFPASQPVSGTVDVNNFPASQAVTGTFWQATQPVSGTFWQVTQPVSGTVSISSFPASQVVTIADGADIAEGALADAAVIGDTSGSVSAKLRGLSKIAANGYGTWNYAADTLNNTGSVTGSGKCIGIRVFAAGTDSEFNINGGNTIKVRNGAGVDVNPGGNMTAPVVNWVSGTIDVVIEGLT